MSASPSPISEHLNIVLLGNLNPAIFHPQWFLRHKIVGEESPDEESVHVVSQQVTEVDLGPVHLFCVDNRLIASVSKTAFAEKLNDLVQSVLKLLPHTPLSAVGINHDIHVRVDSEAHWHKIGHTLAPKDPVWNKLCKEPGMQRLTIQSPVEGWDYPYIENLTVEPVSRDNKIHPAIAIRTNTHFQIPCDADNPMPETSAGLAGKFLDALWEMAIVRSREVVTTIFQEIPR